MNFIPRRPLGLALAMLTVTVSLTACDEVKKGVEAGQMAAATVEHMVAETDRLMADVPADDAAAKTAVAGALTEMADQTGGDANLMQAAVAAIRAKVESWDLEGKQAIADKLKDFESKLAAGEVADVPAAVGELVTTLQSSDQ
jgi:hypothetical protein